jgi:hypothetical protein
MASLAPQPWGAEGNRLPDGSRDRRFTNKANAIDAASQAPGGEAVGRL